MRRGGDSPSRAGPPSCGPHRIGPPHLIGSVMTPNRPATHAVRAAHCTVDDCHGFPGDDSRPDPASDGDALVGVLGSGRRMIRRHRPAAYRGSAVLVASSSNTDDQADWEKLVGTLDVVRSHGRPPRHDADAKGDGGGCGGQRRARNSSADQMDVAGDHRRGGDRRSNRVRN